MLHTCDFSYRHYIETLKSIKNSHKFSFFNSASSNDVILRHDVDSSLIAALKMAKIENELDVQSTYFILFHSEFFNIFDVESSKIIHEILDLGHQIGLHYNENFISTNNLDPTETILQEINLLNHHYGTNVNTVSCHDTTANKRLTLELPKEILDAYDPIFFKNRKYISDSAQYWREGCFCQNHSLHKNLQILIHPMWWSDDNKNRSQIMDQFVNGEYDQYSKIVQITKAKHENHFRVISKEFPH